MFEIALKFDDNILIDDANKGRKESFGIWLKDANHCYPNEGWYDNGMILLSWWTVSWQSLFDNKNNQGIAFMEGPYQLSILQNTPGILNLVDKNRNIDFEVGFEEFGMQLKKAINEVLRQYKKLNLITKNMNSLEKCLEIIDSKFTDF